MLSKGFNNTQIIIRHQTLIKTNNFIYIVIVENLTNHNKHDLHPTFQNRKTTANFTPVPHIESCSMMQWHLNGFEKLFSINKGNNKITELRTITTHK
jgi:hypothetical protein